MKSYTHSRVFDAMKNTEEQISGNLTSLQYLQTLDYFLWEALRPIAAECPSFFYNYLCKVVARQSLKASVKLTSSDRLKLPIQLFNTLTAQSPSKSFDLSKLLYINRGVLFGFISLFLRKLKYYMELHQTMHDFDAVERTLLLHNIELSVGVRPGGQLYPALMQIIHWDDKARWWKASIVEKYTRMAAMAAQRTYKDFNHYVPLDDIMQIYMVITNRAVDRCDARQGVLTTFIQNWFKSARSEVAKLAEHQQDSSYESLTEDHGDAIHEVIGVTLPDLATELQTHISYVAANIDKTGLVRTALGIPQFVARAHREILMEFVYES